jgi:hypothetical protein
MVAAAVAAGRAPAGINLQMLAYPVTELCRVLRAAYAAGDASVAILRSMPLTNDN